MDTTTPLHDEPFMRAVCDTVIPPDPDRGLPGAGSLGLAAGLAAAVEADPLGVDLIVAGLEELKAAGFGRGPGGFESLALDERFELMEGLSATQPFLAVSLAFRLLLSYYQQPEVLAAIGEPPRPPFPDGYDVEPTSPALLKILEPRRLRS